MFSKTRQNKHTGRVYAAAVPYLLLLPACAEKSPAGPSEGEPFVDEIFSVSLEKDLTYGGALDEFGQLQALRLDLYRPEGGGSQLRPAIIWLHGGGFNSGRRSEMREFAERYAKRGYVSATIEYRLREGMEFSYEDPSDMIGKEAQHDAQHDAQAAVRWFRANAHQYRIDPERIVIAGYSAGAVAALRVGYRPEDPGNSGNPGVSSRVLTAVAISGMVDTTFIDAGGATALLIHGDKDRKIPLQVPTSVCNVAMAKGLRCELVVLPGESHSSLRNEKKEFLVSHIALFLKEQLHQ